MLIRCSSLVKIMTEPKTKAEGLLSVGAKTYLNGLAREEVYGFREELDVRVIEKGRIVEDESIALYNSVFFESFAKNTERRNNQWITGECDIVKFNASGEALRGVDIKSAWSLATFPVLPEDCGGKDYEWQARGYMMLWECPEWDIAYCMVNTPDELIKWEQRDLHEVDHIDPHLRVTTRRYTRDLEKEELIKAKAEAAQEYYKTIVQKIKDIHGA